MRALRTKSARPPRRGASSPPATAAVASASGNILSSRLAPTTPRPTARRMVPASVAVPPLEVGGDRQVDRRRDPADHLEHQVDGDLLAVG